MTTRCLLFAVGLLATNVLNAQFIKGQKVLGGNVGFSTGITNNNLTAPSAINNNQFNFNVSPTYGWFTSEKTLVGLGIGYGLSRQKQDQRGVQVNELKNNSVGGNFFVQRFMPVGQKFYFTMQGAANMSYGWGYNLNTTPALETSFKTRNLGVGVGLTPGLTYRLNNRFLFDAIMANLVYMNFSHQKNSNGQNNDRYTQNSFSVGSSFSNTNLGNIGLGFRWLIPAGQ